VAVEKLKLKDNHTWKSRPGYSICVIDRGVVRFDYPSHWIVEAEAGAVHLHDRQPSVESCDLGVSIFPISAAEIAELSLEEVLNNVLDKDRKVDQQSEVHHQTRGDLETAWLEQRYKDEEYKRDARFRVALVRGPVLCLISMNYWANRAAGLERVWDEVLRTLVMGVMVKDPTAGPVVQ
jgi:hypothetical protein